MFLISVKRLTDLSILSYVLPVYCPPKEMEKSILTSLEFLSWSAVDFQPYSHLVPLTLVFRCGNWIRKATVSIKWPAFLKRSEGHRIHCLL